MIIFAIGKFSLFAEISGSIRGESCRGKRFARKHVDPVHSVLAGCLFLRCRAEAIKSRSDPDLLEASLRQVCNELCLRQSTGDSTRPQIDVAAGVLREFQIKGNISQVQASAWFEYPDDFGEPAFLFGNQVEDSVRDDHIDAVISDR